ncbi:MAG: SUMF1/EgtB/PvdO family nonheme iron enzyme [Deltaproteobacteria bacterium]
MATDVRVLMFVGSDLADHRERIRGAVEDANRVLRAEGLLVHVDALEELAPRVAAVGIDRIYAEEVAESDAVLLVFGHRFDGAKAFLEAVWARREEREVIPYFTKGAPELSSEALREATAIGEFREGIEGIVGRFDGAEDLGAKLSVRLVELARMLGAEASGRQPKAVPLHGYLRYLVKQHTYLTIAGLDVHRVRLDHIYVKLRFRPHAVTGSKDRLERHEPSALEDVLPSSKKLAVVGEPGGGKTTLLRYVALQLARTHLGDDAASMGFEGEPPKPVFIELAEAADFLREQGALKRSIPKKAWAALLEHVLECGGVSAEGRGAQLLEEGGLLLLFDGLDEVSHAKTRERLAAAVSSLVDACPGEERPNRVVITCRTRAWGEGKKLGQLDEAQVQPLRDDAIARFIDNWAACVGVSDPEVLRRAVLDREDVRRIATNPQMLTMLASLHTARRRLPSQRALLYQVCVDWLLDKQEEHLDALPFGAGKQVARRVLMDLAFAMQSAKDEDGQPRDALERREAIPIVRPHLGEGATDDDADAYLRALEIHVGLLLVEANVRFHHRTFQEYLVAKRFADANDPALAIADHVLDAQWIEVVALTAGVLAESGGGRVKRFLAALVPDGTLEEASPREGGGLLEQRAPYVGVLATCLADLEAWKLPDDVLAPARAALDSVLPIFEDAEQRTEERVRIAIAEGLGRTRDPRLKPELAWVEIPAGRAWRGAVAGDAEAHDDERPAGWVEVSRFFVRRWPTTVAEYARFVQAKGYATKAWWSEAGWAWREERDVRAPDEWHERRARSNHPVTGVSWYEAEAYARWLTARGRDTPEGFTVRLPTEAEWEKMARRGAPQGRPARYPWGDDFVSANCNGEDRVGGTTPVGCYPAGHRLSGLWDVTGNVWEWCLDGSTKDLPSYEHTLHDPDPLARGDALRVIRGGGFFGGPGSLRVSCRGRYVPWNRLENLGFRVVASQAPLDP